MLAWCWTAENFLYDCNIWLQMAGHWLEHTVWGWCTVWCIALLAMVINSGFHMSTLVVSIKWSVRCVLCFVVFSVLGRVEYAVCSSMQCAVQFSVQYSTVQCELWSLECGVFLSNLGLFIHNFSQKKKGSRRRSPFVSQKLEIVQPCFPPCHYKHKLTNPFVTPLSKTILICTKT